MLQRGLHSPWRCRGRIVQPALLWGGGCAISVRQVGQASVDLTRCIVAADVACDARIRGTLARGGPL